MSNVAFLCANINYQVHLSTDCNSARTDIHRKTKELQSTKAKLFCLPETVKKIKAKVNFWGLRFIFSKFWKIHKKSSGS